jgi:methyl-accepting chemotaxis protein
MNAIKEYWGTLKLVTKFSLVLILVISFLLLALGRVVYVSRKNSQHNLTTDRMTSQVNDLYTILEVTHILKNEGAAASLANAEQLLNNAGIENTWEVLSALQANNNAQKYNLTAADIAFLESKISKLQFYQTGFAVVLDAKGNYVIHPTEKNKSMGNMNLFSEISRLKEGKITLHQTSANEEQIMYFRYYQPLDLYVGAVINTDEVINKPLAAIKYLVLISIFLGIILLSVVVKLLMKLISQPIAETAAMLEKMSLGITQQEHQTHRKDEIGLIYGLINRLISGLRNTAEFAIEIGKKNFEHPFTPMSDQDALGNALLNMRESLQKAALDEEVRKLEDEKRRWTNEGLAKFGEILRLNNDNMEVLSSNIIRNLVKYLKINQGGLFIANINVQGEKYLEMTACYAYDRQKFLKKSFEIGEGITGTCFQEGQTIYMKRLPENYISITSGLGDATPGFLLVVPLLLNEEVHGVIELASFHDFQKHEIEFVEKIGESIASTISGVKINMQTAELLEQSQQQSEEMRAQEEEMRQNMEEMQSTQEELQRRNEEMRSIQQNLSKEKALLYALLESSEDVIYFKDKDSKFLRVSNSILKNLGLKDQSEIIGKSDFDFTSHDVAMQKYEAEQEIIRTGKVLKLEEKDIGQGEERWVSTVKMPLKDEFGNNIGTFGVSRDITHNIKSLLKAEDLQKELELQQKTILKILNEIPQKIYLKDENLKFVFVNQAVANVYNDMTVERLIGTDDFDHYDKELAAQYASSDYEVIKTGEQTFEQIDYVKGEQRLVRSIKKPFYIDHMKQTGLLGMQTDITEIEALKKQLKQKDCEDLNV